MNRKNLKKTRKAFTLMEIILVVAMLALLLSLVVGNLDGLYSQGSKKIAETFVNGMGVDTSLTSYRIDMGRYPNTEEGLQALIANPSDDSRWNGPYLKQKQLPTDPWGNVYQYSCPGTNNPTSYDVWSMGMDGINESEDDIGNWSTESK